MLFLHKQHKTATDSGDVRLPLNLVSERAREGRGRRGVVSLPPSLPLFCGRNQHPQKKPTGALLWRRFRRGRQEQGGAGSRRQTRFLRLRMARPLQKNTTVTTDAARVPVQVQVQVSPLMLFIPDLSLHYEFTSRLGLWLRFFLFCMLLTSPHTSLPTLPSPPLNPLSTTLPKSNSRRH